MNKIAASLVKAKRDFQPVLKDSKNPHFKSSYASLAGSLAAVEPALLANGIALMQRTFEDSTGVTVETVLVHESGETLECGKLHLPALKQDAQGYGSALTYARRYSLMTALGIAPEDDDGHAASAATAKADEVNRTQVMKVRSAIQEHLTAGRDMGVLEEWEAAQERGPDFCKGVWSGLTSPERDAIRKINDNATAKA